MTNILQQIDATLRSFYIFNSNFGKREGEEHKKVLYYHPTDIELNTKIKDVGLSEAIIAFTCTFTDEKCKALHTQKTTQLFYQPEPGYWMILVLNVPKEVRSKDGVDVTDYKGTEVHDRVYSTILEQCYNMFRLLNGTFEMSFLSEASVDPGRSKLEQLLSHFFDKYLPTLKIGNYDLLETMRSIQYLPLDKVLFLQANNFSNIVQATFPSIKDSILLFNGQVVCNDKLKPIDLYTVHSYIVDTMLNRAENVDSDNDCNGIFLTSAKEGDMKIKSPKIYLHYNNKVPDGFYLILYHVMATTLCLIVEAHQDWPEQFYSELHAYIEPKLVDLCREILAKHKPNNASQMPSTMPSIVSLTADSADATTPKYIFVNEQSLKHTTNIPVDRCRKKSTTIPMSIVNVIADLGIASDGNESHILPSCEEVQVKTTNDFWIVKRYSNARQYYVIVFNSKATLLDVTLEARRIFEQELAKESIFAK